MSVIPAQTPRQQKTCAGAAIDNRHIPDIPLDFSFCNITDPTEIELEDEPRSRDDGKKVPTVKVIEVNKDGEEEEVEKYKTKSVRLNNNAISKIDTIRTAFTKKILDPQAITWIDLSCNDIVNIDEAICEFGNLGILYLHGNHINEIKEVDKLGRLALTKLSLHGNPIENTKNYRFHVLSVVTGLKQFDMSGVTKSDRATASSFQKSKGQKKKKSSED